MAKCLDEPVKVVELYSIMRNYKFQTLDPNVRVNVRNIYNILAADHAKKEPYTKDITELKYNVERYPGFIIKLSTPIPRNLEKKTTIKMFHSGKVNIDGAVSEECAWFYYNWINDFYTKHEAAILYVPMHVVDVTDSGASDTSGENELDEQRFGNMPDLEDDDRCVDQNHDLDISDDDL